MGDRRAIGNSCNNADPIVNEPLKVKNPEPINEFENLFREKP